MAIRGLQFTLNDSSSLKNQSKNLSALTESLHAWHIVLELHIAKSDFPHFQVPDDSTPYQGLVTMSSIPFFLSPLPCIYAVHIPVMTTYVSLPYFTKLNVYRDMYKKVPYIFGLSSCFNISLMRLWRLYSSTQICWARRNILHPSG